MKRIEPPGFRKMGRLFKTIFSKPGIAALCAQYNAPDEGETITMSGIVSFNTTDLIQVYAGADNIPYTSDDVFVYAPEFWERISSRLDIR